MLNGTFFIVMLKVGIVCAIVVNMITQSVIMLIVALSFY
jgi:hypothetical protein